MNHPLLQYNLTISTDWYDTLNQAISNMDPEYILALQHDIDWLPGLSRLFAAFSLPKAQVRFVLLGESPYPRADSANGYAFYDQAVDSLWSHHGLSKQVNRATSLRNFLKMLLYARGDLHHNFSQSAIAALDTAAYYQTASAFFHGMMERGFLLLNAALVFRTGRVAHDARAWLPFLKTIITALPDVQWILLGKIAQKLTEYVHGPQFISEHPYNISFITNPDVVQYFKPLDLLSPWRL